MLFRLSDSQKLGPIFQMRAISISFALLVVFLHGCDAARSTREGPKHNVILISIDTLRADSLGCYGSQQPASPRIDELCEESVVFSSATAHAPSTLPSHASILTSLLPYHHGAYFRLEKPLSPAAVTVTEILREQGFRTAAFTGGGQLDPIWGLDQGFESYKVYNQGSFREITSKGLRWIDDYRNENFFLFLHSYEVHHPYTPEPWRLQLFDHGYEGRLPQNILIDQHLVEINSGRLAIDSSDLQHIKNTYLAEIHSMDEALGHFVQGLKDRGLYEDTLIVFTSDHGEEFGEHGMVGWHSHTLYNELLHVPLIIKLPQSARGGLRVNHLVRSIDIAPTILDTVGIDPPESFAGISLLTLPADLKSPTLAMSMIEPKSIEDLENLTFTTGLQKNHWKVIGQALFDLESDPSEQTDVAANHEEIFQRLRRDTWNLLWQRDPLAASAVEIPTDTKEQLKALGYIN